MSSRLVRLGAIATAAGVFSGLFGIGGGTIIVPLLVLWLGYGEREATGTSLAAIVIIAAVGAALHGAYGNIDFAKAAVVGGPAVLGVVVGAAAQQRMSERTVAGIFCVMLVAGAALLIF